ncbi:radical SAM protein [Staphylothermus hellenicus]|uniref:Radical SAM domain protein n=1 Tax=Staphylothermus hellenicus (strain DSM 12710 / JCM 10830 / BK20S6-10-b1 / P8) TaxID=591019 RepID=D7DC63_STAHD|nr:radical SAM protein [Staphylothermus hellenicus]ADI31760.1 Radical SAM domain protein [Staphylothermus hellenicus DSM 12710]
MSREILVFIPGKKFPGISITGNKCWLMCSYCMGRFLKGMDHVYTPKQLYDLARYYAEKGAYGLLISGGFTREGYLPIQPYLDTIREIKKDFELIINVHPGIINEELAIKLRNAGVDIVDYELVLDNKVIRDIKHLNKTIEDYIRTYEILVREGPPYIAPHIMIGAKYGNIDWEYIAIDLLKDYNPYLVVFLLIIPARGTLFENVSIPSIDQVVNVLRYARRKLNTEISMGCMRPPQVKNLLDKIIVEHELVDRIVNPHPSLIRKYGFKTIETCCSVPRKILVEKGLL